MLPRPLDQILMSDCAPASLALATPAPAQVAIPTSATSAAATLSAERTIGDLVVTSNRVATSAQDTPITLNAYSGDTIRSQGVNSIRELSLIDPSVNVTSVSGSAYVAVRKIAPTDSRTYGFTCVICSTTTSRLTLRNTSFRH